MSASDDDEKEADPNVMETGDDNPAIHKEWVSEAEDEDQWTRHARDEFEDDPRINVRRLEAKVDEFGMAEERAHRILRELEHKRTEIEVDRNAFNTVPKRVYDAVGTLTRSMRGAGTTFANMFDNRAIDAAAHKLSSVLREWYEGPVSGSDDLTNPYQFRMYARDVIDRIRSKHAENSTHDTVVIKTFVDYATKAVAVKEKYDKLTIKIKAATKALKARKKERTDAALEYNKAVNALAKDKGGTALTKVEQAEMRDRLAELKKKFMDTDRLKQSFPSIKKSEDETETETYSAAELRAMVHPERDDLARQLEEEEARRRALKRAGFDHDMTYAEITEALRDSGVIADANKRQAAYEMLSYEQGVYRKHVIRLTEIVSRQGAVIKSLQSQLSETQSSLRLYREQERSLKYALTLADAKLLKTDIPSRELLQSDASDLRRELALCKIDYKSMRHQRDFAEAEYNALAKSARAEATDAAAGDSDVVVRRKLSSAVTRNSVLSNEIAKHEMTIQTQKEEFEKLKSNASKLRVILGGDSSRLVDADALVTDVSSLSKLVDGIFEFNVTVRNNTYKSTSDPSVVNARLKGAWEDLEALANAQKYTILTDAPHALVNTAKSYASAESNLIKCYKTDGGSTMKLDGQEATGVDTLKVEITDAYDAITKATSMLQSAITTGEIRPDESLEFFNIYNKRRDMIPGQHHLLKRAMVGLGTAISDIVADCARAKNDARTAVIIVGDATKTVKEETMADTSGRTERVSLYSGGVGDDPTVAQSTTQKKVSKKTRSAKDEQPSRIATAAIPAVPRQRGGRSVSSTTGVVKRASRQKLKPPSLNPLRQTKTAVRRASKPEPEPVGIAVVAPPRTTTPPPTLETVTVRPHELAADVNTFYALAWKLESILKNGGAVVSAVHAKMQTATTRAVRALQTDAMNNVVELMSKSYIDLADCVQLRGQSKTVTIITDYARTDSGIQAGQSHTVTPLELARQVNSFYLLLDAAKYSYNNVGPAKTRIERIKSAQIRYGASLGVMTFAANSLVFTMNASIECTANRNVDVFFAEDRDTDTGGARETITLSPKKAGDTLSVLWSALNFIVKAYTTTADTSLDMDDAGRLVTLWDSEKVADKINRIRSAQADERVMDDLDVLQDVIRNQCALGRDVTISVPIGDGSNSVSYTLHGIRDEFIQLLGGVKLLGRVGVDWRTGMQTVGENKTVAALHIEEASFHFNKLSNGYIRDTAIAATSAMKMLLVRECAEPSDPEKEQTTMGACVKSQDIAGDDFTFCAQELYRQMVAFKEKFQLGRQAVRAYIDDNSRRDIVIDDLKRLEDEALVNMAFPLASAAQTAFAVLTTVVQLKARSFSGDGVILVELLRDQKYDEDTTELESYVLSVGDATDALIYAWSILRFIGNEFRGSALIPEDGSTMINNKWDAGALSDRIRGSLNSMDSEIDLKGELLQVSDALRMNCDREESGAMELADDVRKYVPVGNEDLIHTISTMLAVAVELRRITSVTDVKLDVREKRILSDQILRDAYSMTEDLPHRARIQMRGIVNMVRTIANDSWLATIERNVDYRQRHLPARIKIGESARLATATDLLEYAKSLQRDVEDAQVAMDAYENAIYPDYDKIIARIEFIMKDSRKTAPVELYRIASPLFTTMLTALKNHHDEEKAEAEAESDIDADTRRTHLQITLDYDKLLKVEGRQEIIDTGDAEDVISTLWSALKLIANQKYASTKQMGRAATDADGRKFDTQGVGNQILILSQQAPSNIPNSLRGDLYYAGNALISKGQTDALQVGSIRLKSNGEFVEATAESLAREFSAITQITSRIEKMALEVQTQGAPPARIISINKTNNMIHDDIQLLQYDTLKAGLSRLANAIRDVLIDGCLGSETAYQDIIRQNMGYLERDGERINFTGSAFGKQISIIVAFINRANRSLTEILESDTQTTPPTAIFDVLKGDFRDTSVLRELYNPIAVMFDRMAEYVRCNERISREYRVSVPVIDERESFDDDPMETLIVFKTVSYVISHDSAVTALASVLMILRIIIAHGNGLSIKETIERIGKYAYQLRDSSRFEFPHAIIDVAYRAVEYARGLLIEEMGAQKAQKEIARCGQTLKGQTAELDALAIKTEKIAKENRECGTLRMYLAATLKFKAQRLTPEQFRDKVTGILYKMIDKLEKMQNQLRQIFSYLGETGTTFAELEKVNFKDIHQYVHDNIKKYPTDLVNELKILSTQADKDAHELNLTGDVLTQIFISVKRIIEGTGVSVPAIVTETTTKRNQWDSITQVLDRLALVVQGLSHDETWRTLFNTAMTADNPTDRRKAMTTIRDNIGSSVALLESLENCKKLNSKMINREGVLLGKIRSAKESIERERNRAKTASENSKRLRIFEDARTKEIARMQAEIVDFNKVIAAYSSAMKSTPQTDKERQQVNEHIQSLTDKLSACQKKVKDAMDTIGTMEPAQKQKKRKRTAKPRQVRGQSNPEPTTSASMDTSDAPPVAARTGEPLRRGNSPGQGVQETGGLATGDRRESRPAPVGEQQEGDLQASGRRLVSHINAIELPFWCPKWPGRQIMACVGVFSQSINGTFAATIGDGGNRAIDLMEDAGVAIAQTCPSNGASYTVASVNTALNAAWRDKYTTDPTSLLIIAAYVLKHMYPDDGTGLCNAVVNVIVDGSPVTVLGDPVTDVMLTGHEAPEHTHILTLVWFNERLHAMYSIDESSTGFMDGADDLQSIRIEMT